MKYVKGRKEYSHHHHHHPLNPYHLLKSSELQIVLYLQPKPVHNFRKVGVIDSVPYQMVYRIVQRTPTHSQRF